jgi:hypothetical protein
MAALVARTTGGQRERGDDHKRNGLGQRRRGRVIRRGGTEFMAERVARSAGLTGRGAMGSER